MRVGTDKACEAPRASALCIRRRPRADQIFGWRVSARNELVVRAGEGSEERTEREGLYPALL